MGQVRIIGGKWRSRHIQFPDVPGLRPTHDRLRETLFNWLAPFINEASCLDLFAGSGALGFEALSRGAKTASFVDNDRSIIQALQTNADKLAVENYEIINSNIPNLNVNFNYAPFDIVFLDPPFAKNLVIPAIEWLLKNNLVKPLSYFYIETEIDFSLDKLPAQLKRIKSKTTARIHYGLYQIFQ